MFIITINNPCAGVEHPWFIALTKQQAGMILTGYCIIYEGDYDVRIRVNGRLIWDGDCDRELQHELNCRFRKHEGFKRSA